MGAMGFACSSSGASSSKVEVDDPESIVESVATNSTVPVESDVSTGLSGEFQKDSDLNFVPAPRVDDYNPVSYAQSKLAFDVRERLMQECMTERGYSYAISQFRLEDRPTPPLILERIPKEGYQQYNNIDVDPQLSGEEGLEGYEASSRSCSDSIFEKIYGKPHIVEEQDGKERSLPSNAYQKFMILTDSDTWEKGYSDVRYLQLMSEWTDCMQSQGMNVSSFGETLFSFAHRQYDQPPSREEVQTATVDYHCRNQIGYYMRDAEIQQEYVDIWLEENAATITEITGEAAEEGERIKRLAAELGIESEFK